LVRGGESGRPYPEVISIVLRLLFWLGGETESLRMEKILCTKPGDQVVVSETVSIQALEATVFVL